MSEFAIVNYNMSFDDDDEGLMHKIRFDIATNKRINIPNIYNSHRFKYKLGGYDINVRIDISDAPYMALNCPSVDAYDILLVMYSSGRTIITYWYDITLYKYNWSIVGIASILAIKDLVQKYGEENE